MASRGLQYHYSPARYYVMRNWLTFFICLFFFSCQRFVYSISAERNNILFTGYDNPLMVIVHNISPKTLIVKTDNGTLTGENGHYIFRTDTGSAAVITLYKKKGKDLKEIGKTYFLVRLRPDIRPTIGSYYGGKILQVQLTSQAGIRAGQQSMFYEKEMPVISYTLSIIRSGEYVYREIKNEGAAFTKEVGSVLRDTRPGDSVIFNNIFAKRDDGTTTILEPITFFIVSGQ